MDEAKVVPQLRLDLFIQETENDGRIEISLSDPLGIAERSIIIAKELYVFLESIGSSFTFAEIKSELDQPEVYDMLVDSIKFLDENFFLLSDTFLAKLNEIRDAYSQLSSRPMLTVNESYPADPKDFVSFVDRFFVNIEHKPSDRKVKGIVLPHIDFSIGSISQEVYAKGYDKLKDSDADVFVVFGTSHRMYSDFFMLSEKNYATPLGDLETDKEVIDLMKSKLGNDLMIDDFSHKFEHSIEYQAVLLKYLFPDRNVMIIPILVGLLFDNADEDGKKEQIKSMNEFLGVLKESISELGRNAVYVASVDFAHIGQKFGDGFEAETKLDELREEDAKLIKFVENGDTDKFMEKIQNDCDKWKICGTYPIYTLLNCIDSSEGELLAYQIWDEKATKSAVSFASIAMY